jgi:RimJ/RimL family protein N-acetyltransferase
LPDEVLAQRQLLPRKVNPVTLVGSRVCLLPLDAERDAAAYHARTNGTPITLGSATCPAYDADALVWRFMSAGPFETVAAMQAYLQRLVEMPDGLALAVLDQTTQQIVGITTLMTNLPEHLKIEIGHVSFSPIVQGRGSNTEATYLLLQHAFALGYRRVEWKCNALNERSRRAALRMGFTFEGIQADHVIVKERKRDTAWFRVLASEWPQVQAQLEALLASPQ